MAKRANVLIEVRGGVAEYVPGPDDDRVDVLIFDWDNFESDAEEGFTPEEYARLPAYQQTALREALITDDEEDEEEIGT